MTPEVFISYSRDNSDEIFPIVDRLRSFGLKIWIDQEGIHGAKLWSQEIVNAIEDSKVFILFASVTAFGSKNVTKELALASESDKHILPVFLEDAEIPAAMKYQLAGIQHLVHEPGDTEATVQNILKTLGTLDVELETSESSANVEPETPPIEIPKTSRPKTVVTLATCFLFVTILISLFVSNSNTGVNITDTSKSKSSVSLGVTTYFSSDNTNNISEFNRTLREKLVQKLSRFTDFKVIQTSPVSIDVDTQTIESIIEKNKADYLVVCDQVNKDEEVGVKTFDASGKIVWSNSYDSTLPVSSKNSLIELSTSIISAQLAGYDAAIHRDILQKSENKKEDELNTIELLAKAKDVWNSRDTNRAEIAIGLIDKCISINPNMSSAFSVRGQIYSSFYRSGDYLTNGVAIAKESNNRATRLNPNNTLAIISKMWVSLNDDDYIAAEQIAHQGLKTNPNEPFLLASVAAFYIVSDKDLDKGKEFIDRAMLYNSNPQDWYHMVLESYYNKKKDYKSALDTALKMEALGNQSPSVPVYYWLLGNKQLAQSRFNAIASKISLNQIEKMREENKKDREEWGVTEEMDTAFDEMLEAYKSSLEESDGE